MTDSDAWTAPWSCEKLISHSEVLEAEPVGESMIRLKVKDYEPDAFVATMSQRKVYLSNLPKVIHESQIDFVLNIPKDSFIDGDVLGFAESVPFGIGGLGDLYTAANEKDFKEYLPKETRFILRGLGQHTAVSNVIRANNRIYIINRNIGNPMRVLALNDYDLTADGIRTGIDIYGGCDFILASNPNCRISSAASEGARSAGTNVLMWRQLLGAINNA